MLEQGTSESVWKGMSIRSLHRIGFLTATLAIVAALAPAGAGASQSVPIQVQLTSALDNKALGLGDGIDNEVDVSIATFDGGIDLHNPNLNVVYGVDCRAATAPSYECDSTSPGVGDDGELKLWHGTGSIMNVAAIDDGQGPVGIAPGARLYSIDSTPQIAWDRLKEQIEASTEPADPQCKENCETKFQAAEKECQEPEGECPTSYEFDLAPAIAATKWVTAHASEIDVAVGGPDRRCKTRPYAYIGVCSDPVQIEELDEAIAEMIDAGVVYVAARIQIDEDIDEFAHMQDPDIILGVGIRNAGGFPGNPCFVGEPIVPESWNHELFDLAVPECSASAAGPLLAGAAALIASKDNPQNREDVQALREKLVEAGDYHWVEGLKEGEKATVPLLDVSDEELFDPVMLPGCGAVAGEVDSDVDGDGHADLITLHPDGSLTVHSGGEGETGLQFAAGVDSREEQESLTPALFIGEGDHAVDVADVTADGCADLVTVTSEGAAGVYPGRPDRTFGFPIPSLEGTLAPALLKAGGDEPIAVADVTGDGHADLVVYDDESDHLTVYPGAATGTFASGVTSSETLYSALHTGSGEYFVDAADLTGDGRADLVSMNTWKDLYTRAGKADGTFAAPVSSQWGAVNPALDDGSGREPVGVGDVTGDGKADLVLAQSGSAYVYPALSGGNLGRFGEPKSTASPASTTFGTSPGFEFAGVFDVDANGRADVVGAHTNGRAYVAKGEADGSFSTTVASFAEGFLKSTQHFKNQISGSELVSEKPALRRRGCAANGCQHTTASAALVSGFGASARNGGYSIYPSEPDGDILQRGWSAEAGWSGWGWHGSPSGGQATSESAATPTTGADHIFVRSADGALWQKSWSDAAGKWSEWASLGGELATGTGPAAVSPETTKMDVFARSAANKSVIRRSWSSTSGWGSWETVGGTEGTTGLAVSARNGVLNLFMRDAEGNVTQRWWATSTGWSEQGWHGSPPGGFTTSAPAVISSAQSSVHVFVRGADRALWEKVWNGEKWSAWTSLGGVLRSGPSVTSPAAGQIHVLARAANDSYWRKRWSEGSGWSGWEPVF